MKKDQVEIELRPDGAKVVRLVCGVELKMVINGENWHLQVTPRKTK